MKLIETVKNIFTDTGIFQAIYTFSPIIYDFIHDVDEAKSLDRYYYLGRSGNKTISPLFYRLIDYKELGQISDFYPDLVDIINRNYMDKWTRLYKAMNLTYNAIENYNMTEAENNEFTNEGESKTAQKVKTSNLNKNYGFNSQMGQPANEDIIQSEANPDDNKITTTTNLKESKTHTRTGNIGVTTTQQMLEQELELRKKLFLDIVFKDVDYILTIPVYD